MTELVRVIAGREVRITNADKALWPEAGITKLMYVDYLLSVAPYLLPYAQDRLLMSWRYPYGAGGRRLEEKAVPDVAPDWIPRAFYKDKDWILLDDPATLAWVGNRAALELHVPFDRQSHPGYPTELVFDLDPPGPGHFALVLAVAVQLKRLLDSLSLLSVPRASGATGMQIFVPIAPVYTFEQTRRINRFIAEYMQQLMPREITLERVVAKRGQKLYFDYLQLWKMRTMPAPYSARATPQATVATPVTWAEVECGFSPSDFTVLTVGQRLREKGDLFSPVTTAKERHWQRLDTILAFMAQHSR
jgi:bifunctional non-homologous end joining protein LigD